jgi:hypothetical protein
MGLRPFVLNPSLNLANQFWLFPDKERMIVIIVGLSSLLAKSVHVQLPDVRMHIFMLEVNWQNTGGKLLDVLNDESVFFLIPSNNMAKSLVLRKKMCTYNISYVFIKNGGAFL